MAGAVTPDGLPQRVNRGERTQALSIGHLACWLEDVMLNKAARRWFSGIVSVIALAGATTFSGEASAQEAACGQREQVVKMLETRHAEVPVNMGLAMNGAVVEVFSTVDGTSWSLLMTMPDGRTCLIAAGESWMSVTQISGLAS